MTVARDARTNALIISTAKGNVPLQTVPWSGARQSVTTTSASRAIPLPAGLELIEMLAVEDVYIRFGDDDTVIASSTIASDGNRLFLKGLQVVQVPISPATGVPYTFMAVIRKSADGIFQIESGGANVSFAVLPDIDPDFASVVLLPDLSGVDEATNISDFSNSAHVETFVGTAEVDTAIQMLGENSLLIPNGSNFITYPDSDDWDFGTGDLTIECVVRFNDVSTAHAMLSTFKTVGGIGWYLRLQSGGGSFVFIQGVAGTAWTFAFAIDTTYHIAVSRQGTAIKAFVDGTEVSTGQTSSIDFQGSGDPFKIGTQDDSVPLNGSIGGIRVTKGVARYTANFTAPTVFYPTS